MNKLYVVHILRYGDASLGRSFFGVFSSVGVATKEVTEYNDFRGGKYPVFDYYEVTLDEPEDHYIALTEVDVRKSS